YPGAAGSRISAGGFTPGTRCAYAGNWRRNWGDNLLPSAPSAGVSDRLCLHRYLPTVSHESTGEVSRFPVCTVSGFGYRTRPGVARTGDPSVRHHCGGQCAACDPRSAPDIAARTTAVGAWGAIGVAGGDITATLGRSHLWVN